MQTELQFVDLSELTEGIQTLLVLGRRGGLLSEAVQAQLPAALQPIWQEMVDSLTPGDRGSATGSWLAGDGITQVIAGALPDVCSHHNTPARPDAITELLQKHAPKSGDLGLLLVLDDAAHEFAAGCAVAPAFPAYSRKAKADEGRRTVRVALTTAEQAIPPNPLITQASDGIRLAARLVDMPASELHTDAFVAEALAVAESLGVETTVISGEALRDRGFGGLWNVGMTSEHPPALVVLSHLPEGATRTVSWVGKGIVYDTGGLSIKGKNGMPGMKRDMAGAAAMLGAFDAAVRAGFPDRLHLLLCLAENVIGPGAFRPDDILTMYAGKTVEINNTDAEGRLVLADGVAYAQRDLNSDVIVDMATLTGAQLVATGKRHAAILCNDPELEARAVVAGKASGNLVHPLPYCPEFFRKEFRSKVADLKNSVKDRMNAQSSCAGQFVAEHLIDYEGQWLHVDIAGPSNANDRATGYGVALLLSLFELA